MTTLLGLALRNVLRQKARSGLTLAAIGLGLFMSLMLSAFITGVDRAILDDLVKGRIGALQVHRKGYFDARHNQPLKLDLQAGGELERRLLDVPGVTGVAPRLVFSGLVGNGTRSTVVLAQGIDPAKEARVLPLEMRDVVGTPVTDAAPHGAVVGGALARALGVDIGSSLTLQSSTRDGKENAVDLDLSGLFENANALESKRLVIVPLAYAQELLGMEGRATEYAVAVDDLDQVDDVAARLREVVGPEYEIHTWRELRPNVADIFRLQKLVLGSVSLVFLVIAVMGVMNTLLMSVLERTREIGTMMAVGLKRRTIAQLFVLEAAVQAVLGGGTGAALALLFERALSAGLALPMEDGARPLLVVPEVPSSTLAVALVVSTLGVLGAAVSPALRAASLRPVEALRDA